MSATPYRGTGRLAVGLILVLLGLFLLLDRVLNVDVMSMAWPFFIIVPGLVMLAVAISSERTHGLAVPGSIVTTTGLLLLFQQTFDLFASWAYAWALIAPTAVGFGIWLTARLEGNEQNESRGTRLMQLGGILFAAGFIFFELFLDLSGLVTHTGAALTGGFLLIAGGAVLIYWSYNRGRNGTGVQP